MSASTQPRLHRILNHPGLHVALVLMLAGAGLMSWLADGLQFGAVDAAALKQAAGLFQPGVVGGVFLLSLGCLLASRFDRRVAWLAVGLVCFLAGGCWVASHTHSLPQNNIARVLMLPGQSPAAGLQAEDTGSLAGVVTDVQPEKNRLTLQVSRWRRQPVAGRVQVQLKKTMPLPPVGEKLTVTGDLRLPYHSRLPGAFSEARWLARQDVTAVMTHLQSLQSHGVSGDRWLAVERFATRQRARIGGVFQQAFGSQTAGQVQAQILGGIVLGHHAVPLSNDVKQQFIHTGLIHLLAASGMNVGIIAASVFFLARGCRLPFVLQCLLAMVAVALYTVLSGMPASVLRAAAMLEIALALKLVKRSLTGPVLLGIAAVALLILQPAMMRDLGFQFSILSTYGILVMFPVLQAWLGHYLTRWLAGIILLPLVAQLWVWPLSVFHFNQLPLHTVLLNIAVLVLVTPLTVLGFAAGVLGLLSAPLGAWVAACAAPMLSAMLWVVQWGDGMHWAQQTVASPPVWWVAAAYVLLLLFPLLVRPIEPTGSESEALRRPGMGRQVLRYVTLGAVVLLLPLIMQTYLVRQTTQLTWLPLEGGGSAWLMQPAGRQWPVLGVPATLRYWQGRELASYLRHENIHQLAALMVWQAGPGSRHTALASALKPVLSETRTQSVVIPETLLTAKAKLDALLPGRTVVLADRGALTLAPPADRWSAQPLLAALNNRDAGQLFSLRLGGFCVEALSTSVPLGQADDCPLRVGESPVDGRLQWLQPLALPTTSQPLTWRLRGEQLTLR
ncbi:MAG: ComEC/Rec2 family competence protein [Candidatus Melainabacteria bacterium]